MVLVGGKNMIGGFFHGLYLAINPVVFLVSFDLLTISHGVSFYSNSIKNKSEYGLNMKDIMTGPYKRIVLVHLFVMASGILFLVIGAQSFVYIVLIIALKVVIDLRQHFKANPNIKKELTS
ncbi:MAG: DUF6498-containing protein [Crocinitomicaceae bacterium]|nr:DUF6498-containing protein [Crocinitomicaceae bacterium]